MAVMNLVRGAGDLTVVVLASLLWLAWRRETPDNKPVVPATGTVKPIAGAPGCLGGFLRGLEMFAEVPLFPEQASTTAERVDALFFYLHRYRHHGCVGREFAAVLRRQVSPPR